MSTEGTKLSHVVLHEPLFLPSPTGKGLNLKNTISVKGVEGETIGLKLTLQGEFVFIETNSAKGLIPVSNFKLLVPA